MNETPYTASRLRLPFVRALIASGLLLSCCGCPPEPPSQEEQRNTVTSRWIFVDPVESQGKAAVWLNQADLDTITSMVPTLSTIVVEKVKSGEIEADGKTSQAKVCGTNGDYLRLLKERAKVQVERGRFLESIDVQEEQNVVVLSNSLARKLFADADPVGRTIVLQSLTLKVVGIVSDGVPWGAALTRDAYVPLSLFGPDEDRKVYDGFRFRVESLDQVKATRDIIQKVIEQRHPDEEFQFEPTAEKSGRL